MRIWRIVFLFCLIGCTQTSVNAQAIHEVSPDKFEALLKSSKNAVLIDVRTPEEFQEGHLKGAINIDIYSPDFENEVKKFSPNQPVFLYCHSGRRSMQAAKRLSVLGFQEIYSLKGGIEAWKDYKKPIIR